MSDSRYCNVLPHSVVIYSVVSYLVLINHINSGPGPIQVRPRSSYSFVRRISNVFHVLFCIFLSLSFSLFQVYVSRSECYSIMRCRIVTLRPTLLLFTQPRSYANVCKSTRTTPCSTRWSASQRHDFVRRNNKNKEINKERNKINNQKENWQAEKCQPRYSSAIVSIQIVETCRLHRGRRGRSTGGTVNWRPAQLTQIGLTNESRANKVVIRCNSIRRVIFSKRVIFSECR